MNPLFIYVFAEIMGILLGATGQVSLFMKGTGSGVGKLSRFISLCFVVCIICWSIVHILYKKGIYVKI